MIVLLKPTLNETFKFSGNVCIYSSGNVSISMIALSIYISVMKL